MSNGIFTLPDPYNEPVRDYAPGSPERAQPEGPRWRSWIRPQIEIPLIIGGKEVRTGNTGTVVKPHDHEHVLATYHKAGADEVAAAIDAAQQAHREWSRTPWEERAAVLPAGGRSAQRPLARHAERRHHAGPVQDRHQAEIDAACELTDFLRFNVALRRAVLEEQPVSSPGVWNRLEYRPLEGFVFAVAPFNFTSIAGNLPTAPALMGNTVL